MKAGNRHEHWCGWSADDPRWDDEGATIDHGATRRPDLVSTPPAPPGRRVPPFLVALATVLLFIALMAWSSPSSSTGVDPPDAQTPPASADGCSVTTTLPATPTTGDHLRPDVLTYEVDLEGCARTVSYDRHAGLLTVSELGTYAVGVANDWLGVGDWDCDGTLTPALYRPATGEVFLFDGWAGADALQSEPPTTEVLQGNPEIIDDARCSRLIVHPPG